MPPIWKSRDKEILQHWIDVITDEASDDLNSWETSFMASIQIHMGYSRPLTESQEEKLEDIYVKHTS